LGMQPARRIGHTFCLAVCCRQALDFMNKNCAVFIYYLRSYIFVYFGDHQVKLEIIAELLVL